MASFDQEELDAQLKAEEEHDENLSDEDDDEEEHDEKNFDEWIEDDDAEPVKSLFANQLLPSIQALIEYDRENFGFDLPQAVSNFCTDDISFIKLINYIRSTVQSMSSSETSAIVKKLEESLPTRQFLEGDDHMRPVLSDDPLLYLYEDIFTNIVIDDEDNTTSLPVIKSIEELNQANH